MNKQQKMVRDYHWKMGFTYNPMLTIISTTQSDDRQRILQEEVDEIEAAFKAGDIIGLADALADTLYVVYGTCVACGIDIEPIFAEVHRSNMTKTAPASRTGKAIKGPDYLPPVLEPILTEQLNVPVCFGKHPPTSEKCSCTAENKQDCLEASGAIGPWGALTATGRRKY